MAQIFVFGVCRDIVGERTIDLNLPELHIRSVAELRNYLRSIYPELEKLNSLAIAVNEEYAPDDMSVRETDIIALIPPVSGG